MLPELAMDWIAEVTSERLYGPTTLGAIAEFIRLGEIDEDTFVINSCDATRQQIRDIAPLLAVLATSEATSRDENAVAGPAASGISVRPEDRIRELDKPCTKNAARWPKRKNAAASWNPNSRN